MLGYISSTRRKSCHACVKAKRRCDLRYPVCKRCTLKDLECKYPVATSANGRPKAKGWESDVVVRQTTPDIIPFVGDATTSDTPPITSAPVRGDAKYTSGFILDDSSSDSNESPEKIESNDIYASLVEAMVPQIWEPRILYPFQVNVIVNELCAFVPSMAYEGHTLFIHELLYQNWQPPAYQDSVSLSALYMAKTYKNARVLASSINHKILTLISTSSSWTLMEHLAAVQAMIIYQIIRLFDPLLNQQDIGHRQNALLELWAATLWKRSFHEPDPFLGTDTECRHQSWIFQESLRRTVIMSLFVKGAWSCYTKDGMCDIVPVLSRLPLTDDMGLWSLDTTEWIGRGVLTEQSKLRLTAYGDLVCGWKTKKSLEELDSSERLLFACRKAIDDPKILINKAYADRLRHPVDGAWLAFTPYGHVRNM